MKLVLIALSFFLSTFAFSAPTQQEKDFKAAVTIYSEIMGLNKVPDIKITKYFSHCAAAAEKSYFVLGGLNCLNEMTYHAIHFVAAHEVAHIVNKDISQTEHKLASLSNSFLGKSGMNILVNWQKLEKTFSNNSDFLALQRGFEIKADLMAADAMDKFGLNSCKGVYELFAKFGGSGSDVHASGSDRIRYTCGKHLSDNEILLLKDQWNSFYH